MITMVGFTSNVYVRSKLIIHLISNELKSGVQYMVLYFRLRSFIKK